MEPIDNLKSFFELALTPSAPVFIIGTLIVLLVPVLLHIYLTRTATYVTFPSILLLGPSGAGKTALLTLFERGPTTTGPSATHTSQTPVSVELAVSEDGASNFRDDLDAAGATAKKFLLVDTPGHGKLRAAARALLAEPAPRAVVFVVDSGALAEHDGLAAAASYLYEVLLYLQRRMGAKKGSKAPVTIPVLIAANKADLFTALPASLVKSHLEAELGRIRRTRSKGLLDSGATADDADAVAEGDGWLGEYGSDKFAFSQMMEFDTEIEVVSGNVTGDGPGVDKWWSWVADKI